MGISGSSTNVQSGFGVRTQGVNSVLRILNWEWLISDLSISDVLGSVETRKLLSLII